LLHAGRITEGLDSIERGLEHISPAPTFLGIRALGLALAGRRHEALETLEEIRRSTHDGELVANMPIFALDALGMREEALAEIERAYERRDPHLRYIDVAPRSHLLSDEPRFQAVVRKMGLAGRGEQESARRR
jgi:hypothetical protein